MSSFPANMALLAGRLLLASLFLIEGWGKFQNHAPAVAYMDSFGVPGRLLPLVIAAEVGGGLCLALGLWARAAAVALAVFCLVAAALFHGNFGDRSQLLHFEKDVAIVDAFTQWLIGQPEYYDVCVTTNMFGDIVTDLASVLQGGMGMAVGCNVGDRHAMFEPIHGSAPKHAGKDKVNPMAMLLATAESLRWLGRRKEDDGLAKAGDAIETAITRVLTAGAPLTYDLVGDEHAAPMSAVGTAVIGELEKILAG